MKFPGPPAAAGCQQLIADGSYIQLNKPADIFEKYRPELFRLAYGMLSRVAPAEDAVQETYIRWQKQDTEQIRSPRAWLSKVVSRICLDEIKSAKHRREEYIGPNLPEPLLTDPAGSPAEMLELSESLSMALLVVLDELTPVERAVFLLREVFDYDYGSVADTTGKSEPNCRKIAQRARGKVAGRRPVFGKEKAGHRELVASFIGAVREGKVAEIESLLAADARVYSDGGGKVTAARKPVKGAGKIARFMAGIQKTVPRSAWEIELMEINGEPGMVVRLNGELNNTWSFHIEGGRIQSIYVVLNPDKLKHLKPLV